MRKALQVAALLSIIGFLCGYITLSVRSIRAEQTQVAKPAPFTLPHPESSFQFGPPAPPPTLPPGLLIPVEPRVKSKAKPKTQVPPVFAQPDATCIATADPCQLRIVNRI